METINLDIFFKKIFLLSMDFIYREYFQVFGDAVFGVTRYLQNRPTCNSGVL